MREQQISRDALLHAKEIFLTGTWAGVVPVRLVVEGTTYQSALPGPFSDQDPGPITRAAREAYNRLVAYDLDRLPHEFRFDDKWWLPLDL